MIENGHHDSLVQAEEIIQRNNLEKAKLEKRKRLVDWVHFGLQILQTIAVIVVIIVTLTHFHSETQQQLSQAKNAPAEITTIETAVEHATEAGVICPIVTGLNSQNPTPALAALVKEWCVPPPKHPLSSTTTTTIETSR